MQKFSVKHLQTELDYILKDNSQGPSFIAGMQGWLIANQELNRLKERKQRAFL